MVGCARIGLVIKMKKKTKQRLGTALGLTAGAMAVVGTCFVKGKDLYRLAFTPDKKQIKSTTWVAKHFTKQLEVTSHDGLKLNGYYVGRDNPDFTMVIIHGYHDNAARMDIYGEAFYETFNCDLFFPELRAHGSSQGDVVGYGYLDKEDIQTWVAYLNRLNPERKIVLFGLSMGGGTVNMLASTPMRNVKALVEDCGYSNLYEELDFQCKKETKLPLAPFYLGTNYEVQKNCHYSIKDADGLQAVSKAIYPMMFIHGLDDDVVPSYMVFDLYNACPTHKQLFVVKDAKHTKCIVDNREGYLETLKEFIEETV